MSPSPSERLAGPSGAEPFLARALRRSAFPALAVLVGAILWSGTLGAGWISEDSSVVRHLERDGGWADWLRPQYGMASIHFWRPLVSTTLALQLDLFGPDPLALRLFNAAAHVAAAVLLYRLALALGCSALGAGLGGLLTLAFPHQGGTVTWIVGRVDSLCWPLVLAAALAAARGRSWQAALWAFLAVATKEMGVAAAPLALLCAWAAGDPGLSGSAEARRRRRAALAALVGTVVAVVWRAAALGQPLGGYPGAQSLSDPLGGLVQGFLALGPLAFVLPFALALAHAAGVSRTRVVVAGAVGSAASLFVLMPLLWRAAPAAEHLRWLLVPDGILCLAWAGTLGRAPWVRDPVRGIPMAVLVGGALLFLALRLGEARASVRTWAAAADEAERVVASIEAGVRAAPPSALPLFAVDVPRLDRTERAYTLHLGLTDRFRPPLGAAAREVWPWRPVTDLGTRVDPLLPPQRGTWDPSAYRGTLPLEGPRRIDVRGVDTGGAFLRAPQGATRVLFVSEAGYDLAPLGEPTPKGYTVEQVLGASGATELWRWVLFASDMGARRAFLVLVDERGRASDLVELTWDEATVAALASQV